MKILVPIDFSRHSQETLGFALGLRKFTPLEITLLHVLPSGDVETFAELGSEPPELQARRSAEAAARLEALADEWRASQPEVPLHCQVTAGIPFKEICRLAEEGLFELIVIGTHGRTGLSHLLIGSTAERVVQHASCPVLSIKPRLL